MVYRAQHINTGTARTRCQHIATSHSGYSCCWGANFRAGVFTRSLANRGCGTTGTKSWCLERVSANSYIALKSRTSALTLVVVGVGANRTTLLRNPDSGRNLRNGFNRGSRRWTRAGLNNAEKQTYPERGTPPGTSRGTRTRYIARQQERFPGMNAAGRYLAQQRVVLNRYGT